MSTPHLYFYDSARLIASVKRKASIPDSQNYISDDEILDFANEELSMNLIPLIMSKHEDYFLIREVVTLVADQTEYAIPYRSLGSKVREVAYMDSSGNLYEMFRKSIDDITNGYSSNSRHFHIENENIKIHCNNSSIPTGSIVFFYDLRPNSLVLSERIGTITSIDSTTGLIGFTSFPTHFAENMLIDFIKTKSPHKILDFDVTVTAVDSANKTITVDPDNIPSTLTINDRVGLAGESDLINIPSELHSMLAQACASRFLESIGDLGNLKAANVKLSEMKDNTSSLITNRVTGSPMKAKPRNGLLRRSRGFRRI